MAISEKKRQKKLAKKNKKRKLTKSMATTVHRPQKLSALHYARLPIYECLVPDELFETGLGCAIVARRSNDGMMAVSAFILDVHCLGVKNALFQVLSEYEYENTLKPQVMGFSDGVLESIQPDCARKLVEGAVLYAKELGFSPHPDYNDAKKIFGNIDVSLCSEVYAYGKNGKPSYVRGPYETASQAKQIVNTLSKKCGEDNFHYTVMLDDTMFK